MKKIIPCLLTLFILSCTPAAQNQESIFTIKQVSEGPLVVAVNDTEIHQGFLDMLSDLNPRLKSQLDNPLTRKKILNSLVDQQILYQEAVKKGIDANPDVLMKSLLNKHVIISNALVENELEVAMKKAYEEKKNEQFTKMNVAVIAALFDPEGTAKDKEVTPTQKEKAQTKIQKIKARLDKGDDFAAVAKDESDDKKTQKKGGDAGQISRDDRRFARQGYEKLTEAAFKLKKGGISDPIELKDGWYIIKALSDEALIPYDEAKRSLQFELQNKIKQDLVDRLRKESQINFAKTENVDIKEPDAKTTPQLDSKKFHDQFHQMQQNPKKDQEPKGQEHKEQGDSH